MTVNINHVNKDRAKVEGIFSSIASKYDLMNDFMSLGLHRKWKADFVNLLDFQNNSNYLDIASGSGDIAVRVINSYRDKINHVTLVDAQDEMLTIAKKKILDLGIGFEKVDFKKCICEELSYCDLKYDIITIVFGLRNFSDIELSLRNCYDILNDKGILYIMEFSPNAESYIVNKFYNMQLNCIPYIGKFVANDFASYSYLRDSIKSFLQDEDIRLIVLKNFKQYNIISLAFGCIKIHICKK